MIDAQLDRIADREFAFGDPHDVDMQRAELLLGVDDLALGLGGEDRADIADLATGLAVEGRLVGDDLDSLAGIGRHQCGRHP